MKLFLTYRSPYARKVRIVAQEKGIALELVEEDLKNKSAELTVANPLGKVPVLLLDNGVPICDSPVICEYLDGLTDQPRFIPREGPRRWDVLTRAAIADGIMDSAVQVYLEKIRHPRDFDVSLAVAGEQSIARAFACFEERAAALENWDLASVAVLSAAGYVRFRLPHLFNGKLYPKLSAWFERMSVRPSVAATIPG